MPHPHLRKYPLTVKSFHHDPQSSIFISDQAYIDDCRRVRIGAYSCICEGVRIHGHFHWMNLETQMTAYDFGTPEEVVRPASCLTISHHVWICEGVTILPQVTYIAPHVVIGARAVVTRNLVEEWGMYAGSPARLIKRHKYD